MKKRALLIGVNQYHLLGNLSYARQDAEAVAEALCKYCGFSGQDITLMTCQSEGASLGLSRYIEHALMNLTDEKDVDLLVFGFWGHGFAPLSARRYLCGVDTAENDLERTAVSLDIVKAKLAQVQAENTLLILDCCQDCPTGRSAAAVPMTQGEEATLASMARDIQAAGKRQRHDSIPTVAILNACCEGQKAYEWNQRAHGIFTAHLLDAFEQGFTSIAPLSSWLFDRVAKTSRDLHRQSQTPYITIEGKGDIALIGAGASNKNKKADDLRRDKQVTQSSYLSKPERESKQPDKAPSISPPKREIKPPARQKASAEWWAAFEDGEKGPFTERQIKEFINAGRITSGTELWKSGDPSWQQAGERQEWKNVLPVAKAASTDTHNLLVKAFAKRKLEAYISLSQSIKMRIGSSLVPIKAAEIQNMPEDKQIELAKGSIGLDYDKDSDHADYAEKPEMILYHNPALIEKYRENISTVHLEIRKLEKKTEADYEHFYEYRMDMMTLGELYCILGETDRAKQRFRTLLSKSGTSWELAFCSRILYRIGDHQLAREIYDTCKNRLSDPWDYIEAATIAITLGLDKAYIEGLLGGVDWNSDPKRVASLAKDYCKVRFFGLEQVDKAIEIIRYAIKHSAEKFNSNWLLDLAEMAVFAFNDDTLAVSAITKTVQLAEWHFDILKVARLYKLLGNQQKARNFYKKYHKMREYGPLGSMWILAAERGDPQKQYNLGGLLMDGSRGCYKDKQEAIKWYRKAAAQGHAEAQRALKPKSGCFLTTAVCGVLDKPDDCHELHTLRKLRDTFMQETPEREAEVEEYYEIAPLLIERIESLPDAEVIWKQMAYKYILPCVRLAERNNPAGAYHLYRKMVEELKQKYMVARNFNLETQTERS